MRLLASLSISVLALSISTSASAQSVDNPSASSAISPAPEQPKQHESWYGGQVILADAGSLVLGFGGLGIAGATKGGAAGGVVAVTGIFGYVLGGPAVHIANGRVGTGVASFVLRIGLPVVGMLDGFLIGAPLVRDGNDGQASDEAEIGAGIGFVSGMVGAMVIDAALLARENVVDEKSPSAFDAKYALKRGKPSTTMFEWSPAAVPVRGGATVGIGGVF